MEKVNSNLKPLTVEGSRATLYITCYESNYRLSMTRACIMLIGRPERVKILISEDYKSLAVCPAAPDDIAGHPVPNYVYRRSGRFRLSSLSLAVSIWRAMGWDYEKTYKIVGTLNETENVVVFDLTGAVNE